MPNSEDLDPTLAQPADGVEGDPGAVDGDDEPEVACAADDEDAEPSLRDLGIIIGEQILRDGLYALGDALIEGELAPFQELLGRAGKLAVAALDNADFKALRLAREAHDKTRADEYMAELDRSIELLSKAKRAGLPDEAVMYLLRVLVADPDGPSASEKTLTSAQSIMNLLISSYATGRGGDCGRRAQAQPQPYPVPGMPPEIFAAPYPEAERQPRGMTHADVAAAYGTASVGPNGYIPGTAIQTPFHAAFGGAHGVGQQHPVNVTVAGVNRTVEPVER